MGKTLYIVIGVRNILVYYKIPYLDGIKLIGKQLPINPKWKTDDTYYVDICKYMSKTNLYMDSNL